MLSERELPELCDTRLLKAGAVYAGSYILEFLHGNFVANDVDIFFHCEYVPNFNPKLVISDRDADFIQKHNFTQLDHLVYEFALDLLLYEKTENDRKIQLIVTTSKPVLLKWHLESLFDLDKCACRIFWEDDVFKLVIPKTSADPLSRKMNWMFQNVNCTQKNINKVLDRAQKYIDRGFDVDMDLFNKVMNNATPCHVCLLPLDSEIVSARCNHHFHADCLRAWTLVEPGEEIVPRKSCCPACTRPFVANDLIRFSTVRDISNRNFDEFKYAICVVCFSEFAQPRVAMCGDEGDGEGTVVVCNKCLERMDEHVLYPRQKFQCPNCKSVHEFAGGCQNLVCCVFGWHHCKGSQCDHGSTETTKFCGHRWKFSKENRVESSIFAS